jgi:hypothetical protein
VYSALPHLCRILTLSSIRALPGGASTPTFLTLRVPRSCRTPSALLIAAGRVIQDYKHLHLGTARAIAVREVPLNAGRPGMFGMIFVHRAAFNWFRKLAPPNVFLGRFSIRKRSNIYGLVFGSQHPLGIHKFLQVAWSNDEISGEANFDIERENIEPGELMLPMDEFKPKKIQVFAGDLESALREGHMSSEVDIIHFCIAAGMTCQHATDVLQKLKKEGVIACDFKTPDIKNIRTPRPLQLLS